MILIQIRSFLALWLGSALMGLGCSSVFATVFAFLEQLTPVTARITAGFLIAGKLFAVSFKRLDSKRFKSKLLIDEFIISL